MPQQLFATGSKTNVLTSQSRSYLFSSSVATEMTRAPKQMFHEMRRDVLIPSDNHT